MGLGQPSGIRRGSVLRGVTVRMQCKWPSGAKALEGRVAAVTDDHKGLRMTRTGPPGPGSEVLHRSHASGPRPPPGLLHREPPLPVAGHWGWSHCANPRLWVSSLSTPSRGTVHSLCRAHTVITEGKRRCCVARHPRRCVPVRPRQKLSLGKRQDGGRQTRAVALWLHCQAFCWAPGGCPASLIPKRGRPLPGSREVAPVLLGRPAYDRSLCLGLGSPHVPTT